MTSRTLTPVETLTVLKHLASGKAHHVVATIARVNVQAVQAIGDEHGYPDTEQLTKAVEQLQADIDAADAPPERTGRPRVVTEVQERPTQPDLRSTTKAGTPADPFPAVDDEQTTRLRHLINTAKGIDNKRIHRQLEKFLDAGTTLQKLVDDHQAAVKARNDKEREQAAAKAQIKLLEQQLRAAREALHGPKKPRPTKTPGEVGDGPTAKEIRAWAARKGIDCASHGRVPAEVRAAYDAAHQPGEDDAA